jgi:transcriptional regulator with XRE-family HTH domain
MSVIDAQTAPGREQVNKVPGVLIDGNFLAGERKKRGYSQESFCAEFGLSRKVIKEVEANPQKRIQPQTLSSIASALGIEPRELTREFAFPRLLTTSDEILKTNVEIARTAHQFICTTGSRSRDTEYLDAIENSVSAHPNLAYFRILFDTPVTPQMVKHLRRIIAIRNAGEEPRLSISVGIYSNPKTYPSEATTCLNERTALFVLPSINGAWRYDTAVVFDEPSVVQGWRRWIEEMYRVGKSIKTLADVARFEREHRGF